MTNSTTTKTREIHLQMGILRKLGCHYKFEVYVFSDLHEHKVFNMNFSRPDKIEFFIYQCNAML
jgi:hypothetical protein